MSGVLRRAPARISKRSGTSLAVLLSCLVGCARAHDAVTPHAPPRVVREAFMDEPFELGTARCEVSRARAVITEAREASGVARTSEDIFAVELELACSDELGHAQPWEDALPRDTVIALLDAKGTRRAPSVRTKLSERAPELLVFEADPRADVLMRPRRYDARTGRALGAREQSLGKLRLESGARAIEVTLRERIHDAALDRTLDRLVLALADEAASELGQDAGPNDVLQPAQAFYRDVLRQLEPTHVSLRELKPMAGQLVITFAFEHARVRGVPEPAAQLSFELTPPPIADVLRMVDPAGARESLACAAQHANLSARVERAFAERSAQDGACNVLGVVLPAACDQVERSLLDDALRIRSRCAQHPESPLARARSERLPEDFQLTLRRGRSKTGLDRAPRYVLSLFANGSSVFHGRHWVSAAGRNDGRTSPALLGKLYGHLLALGWFERRGGSWDAQHCSLENELGDVLTVHAGQRERMVLDRDGCRGPFSQSELETLRQMIEQVAGIEGWTAPRPAYADPGVEVWDVDGD